MRRISALLVLVAAQVALADSVTLVESGPNKIAVIKVVRDATGLGLKECKDLVESTPRVVKEKLTSAEALALVKQFADVGARAEAHAADGSVLRGASAGLGKSVEGSWDVRLEAVGPNKILIIKLVREATGLGLKEAKTLVESAPTTVKAGVTKEAAMELSGKLKEAGAQASALLQKS